jgi:ATP synthase A1, C subunit
MSSANSSNPEYVVARVRVRRGQLYSDDDYGTLIRMGPAEIARFMEESSYEAEITDLGARHSGVDLIEYALNRSLARQFDDILAWADGRLYDQVAQYLRKFDAWNLKTIIRGVYTDAPRESVETDLIRAGEFTDRQINRLLGAESIEAIADVVDDEGIIYRNALRAALEDFRDTDILVPLENAIDRVYYENLLKNVGTSQPARLYEEFLHAEIDFRNARNALRLARSGANIDPAEYFIEGGSLFSRGDISRLAADIDTLVEYIRDSAYGEDLSDALRQLEEADSLIAFEHATDAALLEYGQELGLTHPVSVTPVISYVLAKEREVENIRAIARGKEAGLPNDGIEEELVIT